MKKKVTNLYFVFMVLGFTLMALSFICAKTNVTDLSEESGSQKIEPEKIVQVNEDTREFYFHVGDIDDTNSSLVFYASHQYVEVFEDGENVFSLSAEDSIFGTTTGSRWNFVEISPGTTELVVQFQAVYPRVRDVQFSFYQGNGVQILLKLMRGSIFEIVVSIMDFAIGIALLIYWFCISRKLLQERGLLYLGLFAVMMGLWSMSESEMMTILISNRAASSVVGYLLLMIMIAPFTLFVREFLEIKKEKLSDAICIASYINFLVCVTLHMTRISEFKETVLGTHVLMGAALIYLLYAICRRWREKSFDRILKVNMAGMLILAASFAVDIFAYYSDVSKTDLVGRFGFLIYICMLGLETASDSLLKIEEGRKAEIYKELAVKDLLTKMYNRNAYDEWVNTNKKPKNTAVITFDLNNLKQCNDTYGHSAGDRYIKKAAELISQTFGERNACYRIGGDEFCVVVKNEEEAWIWQKLSELERLEQEYNRDSDMMYIQIAHGYAFYDEKYDRDFEATRSRADANMYENKKTLKNNYEK